jgi:hypothetical protein
LFLCDLRTVGSLKAALLLIQTTAFIGATLCGINDPHGYAVRLLSVCELFLVNFSVYLLFKVEFNLFIH